MGHKLGADGTLTLHHTQEHDPMTAAWLTDIHLDFLDTADLLRFARKVRATAPDAVLISGDIAQAPSVARHLRNLAREIARPIYFVLGNHDYYHRCSQMSADFRFVILSFVVSFAFDKA
jgi:3',5'-cyclic AMP phosphodiesterase CpdA